MALLFSVPIFLVCLREVTEAAIIISVLLALVEQVVEQTSSRRDGPQTWTRTAVQGANGSKDDQEDDSGKSALAATTSAATDKVLIRKLRIQVLTGSVGGIAVSACIGAAFLAVYYTQLVKQIDGKTVNRNLWSATEELWEAIFSLVASLMIFVMGLTMLRMDRAKVKWRLKLTAAFEAKGGARGKYMLFFLPFVTTLREGLEAVVLVGGVSLSLPASSIPIAAVSGIACGLLVGLVIYKSSSRLNLSIFLVASTAFLMLIGAGLLSKAAWYFTFWRYVQAVGEEAAEGGDGPGSYPVDGVIWHVDYGNPENQATAGGYLIFAGVFGWNNTMTVPTLLCYIGYWLVAIVSLVYMKWREGRCAIFGLVSPARKDRFVRDQQAGTEVA